MQTPTSANQDQPRNTEGQFKEIANNIYDQVTSDHEADGAINKPEKIIASKSRQDDDLVEHLSEKPGSQAASVKGSRTQLDEVKPKVDPAEIGKTLRELHSKVDEVLRKNTGLRNSMYSGLGASTISERDRRAYVAGTFGVETGVARTYNNPFTGNVDSKGYDPILNTPVRDIRPNANIDINYLKYSQALPRNDRVGEIPREPLKYDKEKLDNIIGNILQRQGISYRPSAEARAANEMTHSKYSNFYQEDARSQAARRANESLHQSRIEAPKPYYYCGELENDEDSIILGYAKQVDEELRKKYNYHCGDLEDDDN